MKNILAFSSSNSSTSINQKLVTYAASQLKEVEAKVLDLRNYEMPIYSEDLEKEGFPDNTKKLQQEIAGVDGLIISMNEHNGSFSAFFKNSLDWLSRFDRKFLENKKVLLMSTSPGKRGGLTVLEFAGSLFPRFGAEVVSSFSLPQFYDTFSKEELKITDEQFEEKLNQMLIDFEQQMI